MGGLVEALPLSLVKLSFCYFSFQNLLVKSLLCLSDPFFLVCVTWLVGLPAGQHRGQGIV